jgi:SAM-dependent methyltransferase
VAPSITMSVMNKTIAHDAGIAEPKDSDDEGFILDDGGFHIPRKAVAHREQDYDPATFASLADIQLAHFWHIGRNRLLLQALRHHRADLRNSAVDLGGGCGGWVAFLEQQSDRLFPDLGLADSSQQALTHAARMVHRTRLYKVDLLALDWRERWDVAFLLDVIEHVDDDVRMLEQAARTLRPGGLLFVTVPALRGLWSAYDQAIGHKRRYTRQDLARVSMAAGLRTVDLRYFMCGLLPACWLQRHLLARRSASLTQDELVRAVHRIPARPVNALLTGIFTIESLLYPFLRVPIGSSLLGVFQRADDRKS